ncbi:RNP domain-containing protein [Coprinopsis cinerea AmutBmut pab1-1]|nr:RNP domain-containing protein [Coprinopsis cinerea AmutBmut pab1-1]
MPYLPAKRLYLRGLDRDVTPEELLKYLSTYGKINEVKFVHNYAFVEFDSESDARLVYNIFRSSPLLGKEVVIQFARPLRKDIAALQNDLGWKAPTLVRRPSPRGTASRHPVVVMGIPEEVRWQELKDFGRSTGCLVAYCDLDPSSESNGFIEYFSKEDAEYAIRTLDGATLGGRRVRVVPYSEAVSERRRKTFHDAPLPAHAKGPNAMASTSSPDAWGYSRQSFEYPSSTSGGGHINPWGDYRLQAGTARPIVPPEPRGVTLFYPPSDRSQAASTMGARHSVSFTSVTSDEDPQYSPLSCRFFSDADFGSRYHQSAVRSVL